MPMQDLLPFFVLFVAKEEKVTTAVTALLVVFTVTLAIAAAILLYKATGDRPEFRIPGIALEIFIGMYLFRVLSIPAVGWIFGFVVAAAQSLVYLVPDAEETVHQFLWLWVAIVFATAVTWLTNVLLFPVSATRLLQREFVTRWRAVSLAIEQLTTSQLSAGAHLLRPLVKGGPIRCLKLLKLSFSESAELRVKEVELRRMILSLDKITRLIFSYVKGRLKSSVSVAIAGQTAALGELKKEAQCFQDEFEAGFVPSGTTTQPAKQTAGIIAPQLREAENTFQDLAVDAESHDHPQKAAAGRKHSLFAADAFTNPRHVQFAIKVTLAGMIGYLFYTASDYYGIHTVFYTPLIMALSTTGATVHKGFLRIVGCIIGGALGLICSIWVIPRFESLGVFLSIVFCVHCLAAWVAIGDDRISYIGLQIALAFDLGFLQGYGPPANIDPIRDRFIGIVLGICIVTTVFSLIWPESADLHARERIAACLRAIARLLHQEPADDGSQKSSSQQEQLELEIALRLSEANSYEEQAAFEELIQGSTVARRPKLHDVIAATEEVYACGLPWIRERTMPDSGGQKATPEFAGRLANAVEVCAERIDQHQQQFANQDQKTIDYLIEKKEDTVSESFGSLEELFQAVTELQFLISTQDEAGRPPA
jgi:multidrug resistance protein MdtO